MGKKVFEGFYKKTIEERQKILAREFNLTIEEQELLFKDSSLSLSVADGLVENVVGVFPLPLGFATNFVVNGNDYLVPFVLEEPSVVAAASNAAKLSTGFTTICDEQIMIGQLQLIELSDVELAKKSLLENKEKILLEAKKVDPVLEKFGGGPRDIIVNVLDTSRGKMIELQLLVDVRDAMGANAINTMLEKISPIVENISGGVALARIISNLAIFRKVKSRTVWKKSVLEESVKGLMSGEKIVERILDFQELANNSAFRCATHNKGIMNGVDSVVIATGNDFRAIEAGAHAFACFEKNYSPLTNYFKNENGDLVGEIELPLALGLVGGAVKVHPIAKINLKIMKISNVKELASVVASVGLAQNFAAMKAIVTTGIQAGHMKLHAKNIAIQSGANQDEINVVAKRMVELNDVSQNSAEKIIRELRK